MSTSSFLDLSAVLPFAGCACDVRGQPADAGSPKYGASVRESGRIDAIARRPAWRDSDPRWRRRMLAGVWVLVFIPLTQVLRAFDWDARLPAPTFYAVQRGSTLVETAFVWIYSAVAFCIGVALLFSKERCRPPARLDWTQRWGVIGSYGVVLVGIPQFAFIAALVLLGIAAMFQTLPSAAQPAITGLLFKLGNGYIHYGPHESTTDDVAAVIVSALVMLLACVPLFNALRSSGPTTCAAILLIPLVVASADQIARAALYAGGVKPPSEYWMGLHAFYFFPRLPIEAVATRQWSSFNVAVVIEAAKWLACLAIAIWLSVAQLMAIVPRRPARRLDDPQAATP